MAFGDLKVQDLIYEDSSNNEITVVIADLATKNNPTFTGTVTVPTATAGDNSTKAASTAFVVASFATKASPTFTGTVTVPTASANDNTTKAASTAYVQTELGDYALKASPAFTGTVTGVNLTLSGNLVVNGTTTTINTQTLDVEDINITLGKVSTPSDTTANNGGITLKGSSDKTFNWVNATDAWTSSEHIHLGDNKKLLVGTGSDLQTWHTGSESVIRNTTSGHLYIQNSGGNIDLQAEDNIFLKNYDGQTYARFMEDGASELYFDDALKLATSNTGCTVTGTLAATAVTGDGSGLTNLPPAGNTVDLVADGAIAAGKPVIITSAGKAAQIVQTSTTGPASTMFNNVSAVQILSNSNSQYPCIVFDPNNNYAVQIASVGGAVKAQCLTLNSSQVVTGTAGSEATIAATGNEVHAIWDETGDRVIVAYYDGNDGHGKILSGRFTSASAMTWYGPYTFQTSGGEHPNVCHDTSSGKTLISYKISGNLLKAKTMTLTYQTTGTGDTASFGSRTEINNNGAGTQVGYWPRAIRVGASKFVVVSKNNVNNYIYTYAVVMSITSGTSLTGSGSIQVSGSNYEEANLDNGSHDVLYDSHNDKIIISYIRATDYNAAWGRVGSVSGTSISWDAAEKRVTIWQGSSNQNVVRLRVLYEPFGKTGYMFYYKNHNSAVSMDVLWSGRLSYDASDANKLDVSNHDHATNTPNNLDTISQPTVLGNLGKILVPVNDVSSTNENYVFSFPSLSSTTTSTNATASNVIGFAENAINDTATGTIKLTGNVVGNQSGLTAGTAYYVQSDGTLGTSQDGVIGAATGFSKAGVALSATSLKISDYA